MQPPLPPVYEQPWIPPPDPLAPARRASVAMYLIGGLTLAASGCCGACLFGPSGDVLPQSAENAGMSVPEFRLMLGIMSIAGVVLGGLFLGLAPFVRRGSLGATIAALVVAGVGVLYGAFNIFVSIGKLAESGGPEMVGVFLPVVISTGLLLMLVKAARGCVAAQRQREQEAYAAAWQAHQQQHPQPQANQGQYGYGQQPPTPPPPAPYE